MGSQEGVIDKPRCWIPSPASPSICSGSNSQKGPRKLNVPSNISMSFPTAGRRSTCSAGFLSPLRVAWLSLNTWQVKPEGTGWGGGRLNRRRRGDARKDPKCFDLRVRWVCGCLNPRPSSPFFSLCLTLPLSPSLSPPLSLFKVIHLFSQTGITARFSSFLSEDHVRLLNVSASFVA